MPMMNDEDVESSARPLPVIVLADVSSSMASDGKIEALNRAMSEMIDVFSKEEIYLAEIHVAVITFGGSAELHIPLQPAKQVQWKTMQTRGSTPMGAAFDKASDLMENQIPARSYREMVVLVSDGGPNDPGWEQAMARLHTSRRGSKAFLWALAIGGDADKAMLKQFLNQPDATVYQADDARQIVKFFELFTRSTSARSGSNRPNDPVAVKATSLDSLEDGN